MVDLIPVLEILLISFCVTASGRSGVKTRTAKRLTNVENRLDTITADISVFRLDINDIWSTMDMFNETVCETKDAPPTSSGTVEKEPKERTERIYSALQKEKQYSRDFMAGMGKNLMDFKSETNIKFRQMIEMEEETQTELYDKVEILQQKFDNAVNEINAEYTLLFKETKQQLQDLTISFSKITKSLETDLDKCNKLQEENRKCQLTITDRDNVINKLKSKLQDVDNITVQLQKNIQELEMRCPTGWHKHKHSCYFLSSSTATWDNAMNWCKRNGGQLVEYSDRGELKFIVDLVKVVSNWDNNIWTGFWTGADDTKHEGRWKWSKSGKSFTFTNWKAHQPDNGSGTEHCMVTLVNSNGQWNDEQCYVRYKFVCERVL
ncbi:C-type lectin domain family 10 member A-like [Mercenaria mercenaria]|uniref:C-type lectin domain family 10 member A-like n=1 Tax=Mercenaria mercenaria TaxID=6596 RepID=UPI00234F3DFA|nr:C-type lectin domain family 10 member A-like [Mercenaria mercenaria]